MKPESARTLWIFALILALIGLMIPNPSGRFFFIVAAALTALAPAIFAAGRARIGGMLACALSLALAAISFPSMLKDQTAYAERVQKKIHGIGTSPPAEPDDQKCEEPVSLAQLIGNPDAYHGKALWVVAHVTIEFENMTACPSATATQMKQCLWLQIDDGPYNTDQDYARYQSKRNVWEQYGHQTVAIHTTFDKTERGHFSMWPGGLRRVTEMSGSRNGWRFTANAIVPRAACQLQPPQ